MTAGPVEKMCALAGGMAVAFLVATALVMVLANVLFLKGKRREFGQLSAMGESKVKIAMQAALEMIAPILAAVLLGLAVGLTAGVPMAESMGSGMYEQDAADAQGQNDLVTYAHQQQSQYSQDRLLGNTSLNLAYRWIYAVITPPQPMAQVDAGTLGGYFTAMLILALLAVLIQAGAVLRLRPAKILTGKG